MWPPSLAKTNELQKIDTIGNGFVTCDDSPGMTLACLQEGYYVPGTPDTLPVLLPQMLSLSSPGVLLGVQL